MLLGGLFLLLTVALLVAVTVVVPVVLFVNRSKAKLWQRVMGRAHDYLIAEYPTAQTTWSRHQWETGIAATSGARYRYLLDQPAPAPPSRAVRQAPWWAVAVFAVIWVMFAAWMLNGIFSGRPVDRSEMIGRWTGHGNPSEGSIVVELRRDGTYTASGFRFPDQLDHTGRWTLFNIANEPQVDLQGRTFGDNLDVIWNFFQPTISVCNGDPDDSTACTTLVKTGPAD